MIHKVKCVECGKKGGVRKMTDLDEFLRCMKDINLASEKSVYIALRLETMLHLYKKARERAKNE